MKWSIYQDDEGRYTIRPSNAFVYFWWVIYKVFMTLLVPFPDYYTRYWKSLKEVKKALKNIDGER